MNKGERTQIERRSYLMYRAYGYSVAFCRYVTHWPRVKRQRRKGIDWATRNRIADLKEARQDAILIEHIKYDRELQELLAQL